ncbi:MAG: hypothetical protein ACYSWS_06285 [Planctomycetota bacterium]|jgi:hypothetical protein
MLWCTWDPGADKERSIGNIKRLITEDGTEVDDMLNRLYFNHLQIV